MASFFLFFGGPLLRIFRRLEAGASLVPASGPKPSGLERPEGLQPQQREE
jgi:hypothetical protein